MIRLTYSASEWILRNPALSDVLEVEQKTLFGRTASNVLFRYRKGLKVQKLRLTWQDMTAEEKASLATAFDTIQNASFTLRDHNNVTYTAIFLTDVLAFEAVSDETDTGEDFYVSGRLIPSSLRQRVRYNVSCEIEVTTS